MSLSITGQFRGVRQDTRDPAKPKYFIGIANNKRFGYEGEEEITEVRLTKDQVSKGYPSSLLQHKDKYVSLPITIQARAWEGRAFVDFYLAGDVKPAAVKPELAKVGS